MSSELNQQADTLDVAKVVIKGEITSFRYPHFMQGVQPTYEMPPPSTIYGHICATTGQYEDHTAIAFALHFTFQAKVRDLEYIYFDFPYVQQQVFRRELLFKPELTLYVTPASYIENFRNPFYPVALGRSQDLMSYTEVKTVTLQRADRAYVEHTLIPSEYAPYFRRSIAVTMARYIDQRRRPQWGSYAVIKDQQVYPDKEAPSGEPIWIDPESAPNADGLRRGLIFNRFV